jgi:hypothetical protein
MSIDAALRAALAARSGAVAPPPKPRERRFAVGDPQAPIETFFEVLDRSDLLDASGWLAADASLISIGDHFDFGDASCRAAAADSGLALLTWLAAHPADQVELIAGNHDLARVGEMVDFDDASFAAAFAEATVAYRGGDPDPELERELLARWPALPTA